ncbi:MAG: DinB family protein [Promethearchaeota archaeon]
MSATKYDERTLKEYAIDILEIAYSNLLQSIQGIKPEEVLKQINPEINPIGLIISHCAAHMHGIFIKRCQGKLILPAKYKFSFKKMKEMEDSFSFKELIDQFMQVADSTFHYLGELPEEKFRHLPEKGKSEETLLELSQRIALHFMGHMGQIRIIRMELGNPAKGFFVSGISKSERQNVITKWREWWEKNGGEFQ